MHWCHQDITVAQVKPERKASHDPVRGQDNRDHGPRGTPPTGSWPWGDIWKYAPLRLSFLIRPVYALLPTPANLCRWGLTDDPKCSLCDRSGTLEHVLSSCSTSLPQGRYRWRHVTVLRELANLLENERKKERGSNPNHHITFVKPGETMTIATPQQASILDGTTGWNMEVDLGRRLVFPDIVQTTLRPHIVLLSEAGKKLIIIELTVPWETICVEVYERQKAKYTEFVDLCRQRWWRTWLFTDVVGVREFCSQSICRLMTAVRTTGREKRKAIQKLSQAAERASSWLWLRREEKSWKYQPTHSDISPLSVHGLKGRNTRWRRTSCWWCWLQSSPYMTVYTH